MQNLKPVLLKSVILTGGFLAQKETRNRENALAAQYAQCRDTGRLDAFAWKEGKANRPHIFWDSDVAKWIEAAAYSITKYPDPELEARVDQTIAMMAEYQREDGYLNSYFIAVEPEERWKNLRDRHELYCAGHLMEAAVAWFEATGKRVFLDVMCRYADYIATVFGPAEEGRIPGYPGHPEIELALVKLYRVTGEARYLDLARFFVCERGSESDFFRAEAERREETPRPERHAFHNGNDYYQAHMPLLEQATAEGHAVRACYLYAGLADVAAETGDARMRKACRTLWRNITERRMYITGGIGSCSKGERFSVDYDLPDDDAYAETCASIALIFFAQRMLHLEGDGEYADVMETALYNGVLAGVSEEGDRYFYANRLAVIPEVLEFNRTRGNWSGFPVERQEWFGCACCPPNLARLLAGIGAYLYSRGEEEVRINLYASSEYADEIRGISVTLQQETGYPFTEGIAVAVEPTEAVEFTLSLRIPGWCEAPHLLLNGEPYACDKAERGYLRLKRVWNPGDRLFLRLPMPIRLMSGHPAVFRSAGKCAVMRGPLVYCLEEHDNGKVLHDIRIDTTTPPWVEPHEPGTYPRIRLQGWRRKNSARGDRLYAPIEEDAFEPFTSAAVPYFYWGNRGYGEMLVWLNYASAPEA